MNPSRIGNQTSGFPNYSNSNQRNSDIGFNTSSGRSTAASSRPRFVKARRQSNSQNLRPKTASDTPLDPGFNPFRTASEFLNPASTASRAGTSTSGGFGLGKSESEAFAFGANRVDLGASTSMGRWNSRGGVGKGVIEEFKNLNIQNEKEFPSDKDGVSNLKVSNRPSSSPSMGSGSGSFVFGSGFKKGSSVDEIIELKLPEEMRKLNVEGPGNNEHIEKINDGMSNLRVNDTTKFGFASGNNVAGFYDNPNIKDSLSNNSSEKNEVNIENDEGNTNTSYDGRKEAPLLSTMEKLKLGSEAEDFNRSDARPSSSRVFVKEMQMGHFGDMLYHDLDKPMPSEFTFQVEMQVKGASGNQIPLDQQKDDAKVGENVPSSSSSSFSYSDAKFSFTSKQDGTRMPFVQFKTPKAKVNLFSGLNQKIEFNSKRESIRGTRARKKSGKLKHATPVQLRHGQDFVSWESSSQENSEASESYSPMDISPYQEALADNQHSRENSVTSDESFRFDNNYETTNSAVAVSSDPLDEDLIGTTDSSPAVSSDAIVEDLIIAAECMDINRGNSIFQEAKVVSSESYLDKSVGAGGPEEESLSGAETESFKSAVEEVDDNGDGAITSKETELTPISNFETVDSDGRTQVDVASSSEDTGGFKFTFAASSAAQHQLSSSKRHQKKKNLLKVGHDIYDSSPKAKVSYASSSANLFPFSGTSLPSSPRKIWRGDLSTSQSKLTTDSEVEKQQEVKGESAATVAAQEACEKWRQRGNQAYLSGDLSKAEDYYTQGVNCISASETSKSCLKVLVLCYSNRAAARMSLGRMRDALGDCMIATVIDPNFLKVQLRAANCYLALGEVEDASQHFKKCLQSGNNICMDRKIVVEASDGLQKAQKVLECMNHSTELLKRGSSNDADTALEVIAEALMISLYSEKLLEMKAEALFMLRRYDEVIQLCNQTLGSAEKNYPLVDANGQEMMNDSEITKNFYFKLWRCRLIFKAYFHLGRFDEGLTLLEEQEVKLAITKRSGSKALESSIPLAGTVRELLRHKTAGNEAFQAGRIAEAVDHYTAALSHNAESRPFAAVCFCNRAAAYKALGQITDAIADCCLAIALDGNYLKAISRRAALYERIRDYGQAAKDLQRLVSLLTKQVEGRANQSGASDRSTSGANDLRQTRLRLSEIEEEARKEIPLDMYLILGIEPSVSASEIKKAYRKAALRHHPDKAGQYLARSDNGDDRLWKEIAEEVHKDAEKLFKMIGEAYAVLSDPVKRSRYDAEEEMRNAQKTRNGSSTARMHTDTQFYPYERNSTRRQRREVWRSYGNSPSGGSDGHQWGRHF